MDENGDVPCGGSGHLFGVGYFVLSKNDEGSLFKIALRPAAGALGVSGEIIDKMGKYSKINPGKIWWVDDPGELTPRDISRRANDHKALHWLLTVVVIELGAILGILIFILSGG